MSFFIENGKRNILFMSWPFYRTRWPLRKLIKSYALFHHISSALRYICTPSILQFLYLKWGANVSKIKHTKKKTSLTQSVNCLIQNVPIFTSEVSKTHRDILIVSKVNRCIVFSEVFPWPTEPNHTGNRERWKVL